VEEEETKTLEAKEKKDETKSSLSLTSTAQE